MDRDQSPAGVLDLFRKFEPAEYTAAGKKISCFHCGNILFVYRRVLVHGPLAHGLTCTRCGLALWFEVAPEGTSP